MKFCKQCSLYNWEKYQYCVECDGGRVLKTGCLVFVEGKTLSNPLDMVCGDYG